jgi:phosphate transport system substrate-binding protein
MAQELDYVPMPDKVVKDVQQMWSKDVKDASGKSVYTMTN